MAVTDADRLTLAPLITALQDAVALPPKPAPSWPRIVEGFAAVAQPADTYVDVRVALDQPADQTIAFHYLTGNGTAREGYDFTRTEGSLVFQRGEQFKTVRVPVTPNFTGPDAGEYFVLTLSSPLNSIHPCVFTFNGSTPVNQPVHVTITSGGSPAGGPVIQQQDFGLPEWPVGMTEIFHEDFSSPQISDTGQLPDGTPCWRNMYYDSGRDHGDKGYYASPDLDQAQPYGKDANGQFFIQAQGWPNGLLDASGNPVINGKTGKAWQFTSTAITTEKLFHLRQGMAVEGQCRIPNVIGSWPALWFYPIDWSWPSIEGDLFEAFQFTQTGVNKIATTTHWEWVPGSKIDEKYDQYMAPWLTDAFSTHIWGCHWGADLITYYLDRQPYLSIPNMWPDKPCLIAWDVAVGGNPDPTGWQARMEIDWLRVWQ